MFLLLFCTSASEPCPHFILDGVCTDNCPSHFATIQNKQHHCVENCSAKFATVYNEDNFICTLQENCGILRN